MKNPAKKLFVVLSVALPLAFAVALTSHAMEGPSTTSTNTGSKEVCGGLNAQTEEKACHDQGVKARAVKTDAGCYKVECTTEPWSAPPPPMQLCSGAEGKAQTCATDERPEKYKTENSCIDVKCVKKTEMKPELMMNKEKSAVKTDPATTDDSDVITFTCKGRRSTGMVECFINGKSFSFNMNTVRNANATTTAKPIAKPKPLLKDKCLAIAEKINAAGTEKSEDGSVSSELKELRQKYADCRSTKPANAVLRGSVEPVDSNRFVKEVRDGNCWYKVNEKEGTKTLLRCSESQPTTVKGTAQPASSSTNVQ